MGHILPNLIRFVRALRALGLEMPASSAVEAARATRCIDLGREDDFRLALRAALVRRPEDLQVFDDAFRIFWKRPSGTSTRLDLRPLGSERPFGEPAVEMESLAAGPPAAGTDAEERVERVTLATYSDREVLRTKDFKGLSSEEEAEAARMLAQLRWRPPERRTKRWRAGRGAAPDLRALLARLARREADPGPPPTRVRKTARRRLVLLCDISGSMERYTRMLLWFATCLSGTLSRTEAFVFATRLTRVTKQLRPRGTGNPLRAIGRLVPDWSGGTCIGDAVRAFNLQWARRAAGSRAVVLVVSDGWDRGDPAALAREMARLQRSCHRLIWLSPLLGDPRYEPLTRGLQAALPYVDDFLPAHNLVSLERLAAHLNSLCPEPPGRPA